MNKLGVFKIIHFPVTTSGAGLPQVKPKLVNVPPSLDCSMSFLNTKQSSDIAATGIVLTTKPLIVFGNLAESTTLVFIFCSNRQNTKLSREAVLSPKMRRQFW